MVAAAKPEPPQCLCVRERDIPAGTPAPADGRFVSCGGCGCRVLTSPATRAMIRAGQVRPVCQGCLRGERLVPVMTAEQADELLRMLGVDPG